MREESVKVYSFEELDENAQEKAIDNARYHSLDYDWWDFLFDEFSEELDRIGIDASTFSFDTGRNETFYANKPSISSTGKLLRAAGIDLRTKEARRYIVDGAHLAIQTQYFGGSRASNYVETYSESPEIEQAIQDLIDSKFGDFLKRLREEEDYLTSDEHVKENLIVNEHEFTEDGERWP